VNTLLKQLLASKLENEEDTQIISRKRGVEEQQKAALIQCLSLSQAAADGATPTTSHSFQVTIDSATHFDGSRARQGK
jgi:hypothetical protein